MKRIIYLIVFTICFSSCNIQNENEAISEIDRLGYDPNKDSILYSFMGSDVIVINKYVSELNSNITLRKGNYQLSYNKMDSIPFKQKDRKFYTITHISGESVLADIQYSAPKHRVSKKAHTDLINYLDSTYFKINN